MVLSSTTCASMPSGRTSSRGSNVGHKGFVEEWTFTPEEVYNESVRTSIRNYYDLSILHRHWSLDVFDKSDGSTRAGDATTAPTWKHARR